MPLSMIDAMSMGISTSINTSKDTNTGERMESFLNSRRLLANFLIKMSSSFVLIVDFD